MDAYLRKLGWALGAVFCAGELILCVRNGTAVYWQAFFAILMISCSTIVIGIEAQEQSERAKAQYKDLWDKLHEDDEGDVWYAPRQDVSQEDPVAGTTKMWRCECCGSMTNWSDEKGITQRCGNCGRAYSGQRIEWR